MELPSDDDSESDAEDAEEVEDVEDVDDVEGPDTLWSSWMRPRRWPWVVLHASAEVRWAGCSGLNLLLALSIAE